MASIAKVILSGSTNGRLIQVTATTTTGTLIHTAASGTASVDEVTLYAVNTSTVDVLTTVEFGGTGTANEIKFTIPAQVGPVKIVEKLVLQNSLVVRCYADTASVINIGGYVNRVTS